MSLKGITVLELAGLAPSPYCGLILQQHGANVIRVDRSGESLKDPAGGALSGPKPSIAINLKSKEGIDTLLRLAKTADVLIEPYRPGVMEKLGLGPDVLLKVNPRLIYARLTGWGQTGNFSQLAGHDINYLGLTGMLDAFRRHSDGVEKNSRPLAPVNLLGDFAGGGMHCALGILMALVERFSSGKGQVVDVSMVDGVVHLSSFLFRLRAYGAWDGEHPGTNVLDSGAPFYDTYTCADGKFMTVGCIEPSFYKLLLEGLRLENDKSLPKQMDVKRWPELRARLTKAFLEKTRDEWTAIFSERKLKDACCTPVLSMMEAPLHPQMQPSFQKGPMGNNDWTPKPSPRFSRTPGQVENSAGSIKRDKDGESSRAVLQQHGFSNNEIDKLIEGGHVVQYVKKARL